MVRHTLTFPWATMSNKAAACVLAPTLFSVMLSAMLTDAFNEDDPGVSISYRTDWKLFNTRRLSAVTKVKTTIIRDLLLADDCALHANSEPDVQHIMDQFSWGCDNFGLTISLKKTGVMHQPEPRKTLFWAFNTSAPDKAQSKVVDPDIVTYLDNTLSRVMHIDDETDCSIVQAGAAFGRLRSNIWEAQRLISQPSYNFTNLLLSVPCYVCFPCESWTVYATHVKNKTKQKQSIFTWPADVDNQASSGMTKYQTPQFYCGQKPPVNPHNVAAISSSMGGAHLSHARWATAETPFVW